MGSKRAAWFLAVAMLPMLTYMGHWENPAGLLPAAILGEFAPHSHESAAHPHSHGEQEHHTQHCHGDVASCSDIPYAGSATVVFLAYAVDGLAMRAPRWLQDAILTITPAGQPGLPSTPPPKHG